ncbi:YebC/PmpR family DNA-binding regulatory protein [Arcticibacter tournemirensis]|uniref:Probable transcriptional regulatory protein EKH83_15490 n=1 Tax=Arcticibacter tournemirensis TaxID=699437 RepID=A0A4V1KHT2_9SPHI|nr:YebC/PmpR family DNA-binding transcriptional regulator [Arcticibacter tournemirensis]KAA8480203.1 YebC/PmpR family DNA-binding transcriptional regulator [Arcticibacter tournemirensis]RXF68282.1 YebC/PmpR family DNA-binding transcriptional regulator [Arcticibacter tournemirensis]TQM52685.1 YebC/PmpR family DNA-binding regulatory protein [Arcticibacter tournemirensis]
MGRAFEFRKERKFKRWAKMAVQFTRLGKEIAMAVKAGGPHPETNSRLRTAIQNSKAVNMPKDRVEAAIKRASSKEEKDYEEIVYEGYAPHGVAVLVETATDNTNRTVANVRSYFNKTGGTLGKTGSLDFIFSRKSVFRFDPKELDLEELEFELIDAGLEDLFVEADEEGNDIAVIHTSFEDFGKMQKTLEEKGIEVKSAKLERIALSTTEISEEQAADVLKLIDKLEEDDDVQAVYHNMA